LRLAKLVGPDGIEPSTSPLSGVRSSHLSYGPRCHITTLLLFTAQHWWSWSGSNRRPPECKSGALPAELQPLFESGATLSRMTPPIEIFNRGQLDTGTKDLKPSATFRSHFENFKWSSGSVLIIDSFISLQVAPKFNFRLDDGLWNGTTAPYSPTLYTQTFLAFRNSIHGLS
jgi:hypothetical protein